MQSNASGYFDTAGMYRSRFCIAGRQVDFEIDPLFVEPLYRKYLLDKRAIDWFIVSVRHVAVGKPKEFATILQATKDLPLFYLEAHGNDEKGRWYYYGRDGYKFGKRIPVEERLANVQAGGAVIISCNPGHHVLRDAHFPVLYQLDTIQRAGELLWHPEAATLATPEGMTVQTERVFDIVSDFLDLLCEDEIRHANRNEIRWDFDSWVKATKREYDQWKESARFHIHS